MTSSGSSSGSTAPGPRSSTREQFALTGPSAKLDPRIHALRGDLADIRLADRVFAPHYAKPMPCRVARATQRGAMPRGEVLASLAPGEPFELLELAGDWAWGTAAGVGLVGYCERSALA